MPSKLILKLRKYKQKFKKLNVIIIFIVAGLIKYSKKRWESLNDMQGHVNLSGQAITESLLYLKFQG